MKKEIEELLDRGVEAIYPSRKDLASVLQSGKKLKLYQGFDPTGIQLHIGHMVGLMKLKQWQDLGHEVIFLIGDGTGQAGDPSGKTRSREKYLSNKELRDNAKDYVMQAGRIVRFEGKNAAKILYNGDWLNSLTLKDILSILDNFSLQQLEERDLYVERKKRGEVVNMREFMYPVLQAYDSVEMSVDLEVGGSDQIFNMLCGRTLMKKMLNREKFVMATPLLTDSNGKKIGKTEGNVIALDAKPRSFYGMIMSLSDDVIVKCFEYITDLKMEKVREIESKIKSGQNPMIFKKQLAYELTRMLHGENEAAYAQEQFVSQFQNKETPDEMKLVELSGKYKINIMLLEIGAVTSNSQARRLIQQGGVKIDGAKIGDPDAEITTHSDMVVQVGKLKFWRIK